MLYGAPKRSRKINPSSLRKRKKKQDTNRKERVSTGKNGAKARWEPDSKAKDLPLAKNSSSSSTSSSSASWF